MSNGPDPTEITIEAAQGTYLVQSNGHELRVGKHAGDAVLWQDETVPISQLPERARTALDAGDAVLPDLTRFAAHHVERTRFGR